MSVRKEFSDYVEGLSATDVDGSELIPVSKEGQAASITTAGIAALIPASNSDYTNITVATTGANIVLPHNSKYETFFTGLTSFATPKTVIRTGEDNTMRWTFMWEITDIAATLDFGPDTRSPSNQFAAGVFTPLDVGAYKVVATRRYDDIWWLDFKGVYSVGDAPPIPDPTNFVLYNDDSEVLYNDGSNAEYDS